MPDFTPMFEKSKGQPIAYKGETLYMVDEMPINETQGIKLYIERINSDNRQGLYLKIKRGSIVYKGHE